MLDLKFIREHPDKVKESNKKRGLPAEIIDNLLALDTEWRELKAAVDTLRSKRNKISEGINQAKKSGEDIKGLIEEAKQIPKKLEEKERIMNEKNELREKIISDLPNLIDKSVPIGNESKNKVLKKYGKISKSKSVIKDHSDLLEELDVLDVKKASETAGSRFYYLKGDLVKLNYAIINFALDFLKKREFTLIQPPYMLKKEALAGAIPLAAFEEMIYKVEGEDLYLIGTSEHAINAYCMNEILPIAKLPLRFAGISPCFRKEAGAHGKDTKGIFRIHQFEKIEQFVFCKQEDSWKEFENVLKNSIDLFKLLGIPFRTIVLASQDTGRVPTKTIDLEGWFPSQKAYRELGSCSNCLDYQARRSSIKYQDGSELKFVHTLNNTAIATERMIVCIVENFQQKDGSIKIPKALWKYTGFKVIKKMPVKKKK